MRDDLTMFDKLLLAASHCDTDIKADELVVQAWKRFPEAFGLNGRTDQHPSDHRVYGCLDGARGIIARGWLLKTNQRRYRITLEGKARLAYLQGADEVIVNGKPAPAPRQRVALPPAIVGLLGRLARVTDGEPRYTTNKAELTFTDATRFWGFESDTGNGEVPKLLKHCNDVLRDAEYAIGNDEAVLPSGRAVDREDVRIWRDLNDYLEHRFARHLAALRAKHEATRR